MKTSKHIKRQAQRVALNLNVAFLHDVEQSDLNFSREVGQLVDAEDAAIGAGKQAVVNGQLVGKIAAAARGANGIHVADDVGHGDVRRGQLFDIAAVARHPGDGRVVAFGGDFFAAGAADGLQRVIVDFAADHHGNFGVEQIDEAAQNAALGLAAKPQKNEIVAREQGIHDLRHDGIFVTMNPRK